MCASCVASFRGIGPKVASYVVVNTDNTRTGLVFVRAMVSRKRQISGDKLVRIILIALCELRRTFVVLKM